MDDPSIEWQDVADLRAEYFGGTEHIDTIRKGSKLFYEYLNAGWIKNPDESSTATSLQMTHQIRELQKERYKLQTEKLEINRWLRENARDELIVEHIRQAVDTLEPLVIPEPIIPIHDNREYLFCFGDCHYGIEFEINDLDGNVINAYSPEIFENRMWDLLSQILEIVQERHITELNVWDLGDNIQGILRLNSQLMKLRYGIIDSSLRYADFVANWLNELSKKVKIRFQMVVDSNHNQLRICNAPKNAFKDENMSKVILCYMKQRLIDNPNVEFVENPTGMDFSVLSDFAILGIHGEVKNLAESLSKYSIAYKRSIDYIIGAHCHHFTNTEIGRKCESIQIRSIIGVDPYGLSLNATSDSGASLLCFEQGKGLICDYKLILN